MFLGQHMINSTFLSSHENNSVCNLIQAIMGVLKCWAFFFVWLKSNYSCVHCSPLSCGVQVRARKLWLFQHTKGLLLHWRHPQRLIWLPQGAMIRSSNYGNEPFRCDSVHQDEKIWRNCKIGGMRWYKVHGVPVMNNKRHRTKVLFISL